MSGCRNRSERRSSSTMPASAAGRDRGGGGGGRRGPRPGGGGGRGETGGPPGEHPPRLQDLIEGLVVVERRREKHQPRRLRQLGYPIGEGALEPLAQRQSTAE